MNSILNYSRLSGQNEGFRDLYREVQALVGQLPQSRLRTKRRLAIVLPILYGAGYLAALSYGMSALGFALWYAFMGVVAVVMFVSLIHDAVHGHVFKTPRFNRIYLFLFDLIGGNSFIWKQRHLCLHHHFPNVSGFDADIEQSGPIKIFPHAPPKKIHNYQHYFVFLLYPLFLFNWIFIRDFRDFFQSNRMIRRFCVIPKMEYLKLICFKGLFFGYLIVLPLLLGVHPLTVALGVTLMMVTGSILALLVLLTPHANTGNDFPLPDPNGVLPLTWLEHQFHTTNDLKANSWIFRHILGNFNYHLSHHLFPQIHSAFAPEVTTCIREFAVRRGLPYKAYPLGKCLRLHYQLILRNARSIHLFEEDM